MLLALHWDRTEATMRHAAALARFVAPVADVVAGWMSDADLVLSAAANGESPPVRFALPGDLLAVARFLRERGLVRANVLRAGPAVPRPDHLIDTLLDALNVPFDVTLFDHALVARDPDLLDQGGRFPGEDGARRLLRPRPELFAARAARLFAVSRDLARRLDRLVPGLDPIAALPPESLAPDRFRVTPPPVAPDVPIDVVLIGDLTRARGRDVVVELAALVERDHHPVTLTLIGRVSPRIAAGERTGTSLTLAGRATAETLTAVLQAARPRLAWFPHCAPMSRNPAVDDALLNGLPVMAAAIGDLPERLGRRPASCLLPPETCAVGWLEALLRLRREGFPPYPAGDAAPADTLTDREQLVAPTNG